MSRDGAFPVGSAARGNVPLPQISGYEVLAEIGRGGMGIVYRARQLEPPRLVALKTILDGRFASEHDRQRFRNETETVAALDHPNIVAIYDVGQQDGLRFFSMRLLTGGSLADAKRPELREDMRRIAELVAEIAGTIHDAAPARRAPSRSEARQYLARRAGSAARHGFRIGEASFRARRADGARGTFGLAWLHGPRAGLGRSLDHHHGNRCLRPGSDTLRFAHGPAPFDASSAREALAKLQDEPPSPPTKSNPRVPRVLEVICLKCLEKVPGRRYPSALALADDLRRWLAGEPIIAKPASAAVRTWLWVRRRPAQSALALALAAAITLGTTSAVILWQKADAPSERRLTRERTRRTRQQRSVSDDPRAQRLTHPRT